MASLQPGVHISGTATMSQSPSVAATWMARVAVLAMWPTAWWLSLTSFHGWGNLRAQQWSPDAALAVGIGTLGAAAACYLALVSVPLLAGALLRRSHLPTWLRACTPQPWRRIVATALGGALSLSVATASFATPLSEPDGNAQAAVTSAGWLTVASEPATLGSFNIEDYAPTEEPLPTHQSEERTTSTAEPAPGSESSPAHTRASTVTVRRGDSLWLICAGLLPATASDADIAHAWPLLYRANKKVIGDNPGLIYAGQTLDLPAELQS